jgi:2'-5' RNA ligase
MNATHAIVVPFVGLAPVVDDLRERTCVSKPSHGMPPHVTLLYPAPSDVDAIAGVLLAFSAFEVVFARLDRFPGTVWLAPEPAEPFLRVIEALIRRFPEHRPYDGAFAEIVPHLTVAQSAFDDAVAGVETSLPLRSRAERAVLLEQAQPDRWREVAAFELERS